MKKIDGKDCICYQEDFWGTKVEEDGSVTFTMEAPKAETVEVSGFGGTLGTEKIALEKQANGLFSKNVKGILPGFHYHRWFVDGVQVTNHMHRLLMDVSGQITFLKCHGRDRISGI